MVAKYHSPLARFGSLLKTRRFLGRFTVIRNCGTCSIFTFSCRNRLRAENFSARKGISDPFRSRLFDCSPHSLSQLSRAFSRPTTILVSFLQDVCNDFVCRQHLPAIPMVTLTIILSHLRVVAERSWSPDKLGSKPIRKDDNDRATG
jgi:hypothetical protein